MPLGLRLNRVIRASRVIGVVRMLLELLGVFGISLGFLELLGLT